MKNLFTKLAVVSSILGIISCDSDDPEIPNEVETVTTVVYTLTPTDSSSRITPEIVTFTSRDLDGPGGENAVITVTGELFPGTYEGDLQLLNEAEEPVENEGEEVLEEADDHQIFYILDNTIEGVSIDAEDRDSKDRPLGLKTTVTLSQETSGSLRVVLRHFPNKDDQSVQRGDITNAGGETEADVTFSFTVK